MTVLIIVLLFMINKNNNQFYHYPLGATLGSYLQNDICMLYHFVRHFYLGTKYIG